MLHYFADEPPLNREPAVGSTVSLTACPTASPPSTTTGSPAAPSLLPRYPLADAAHVRLVAAVHEAAARNDATALMELPSDAESSVAGGLRPLHARDSCGRTALHWAAKYGAAHAALVLLQKGAPADAPDLRGYTPLLEAAEGLHPHSLVVLLRANASVRACTPEQGATALHLAVASAAAMLRHPPGISFSATATGEQRFGGAKQHVSSEATEEATRRQRIRHCLLLLLRGGVAVNAVDHEGDGALHWAVREGSAPVVAFLVQNGADPLRPNQDGESALQLALELGEHACVQAMDPNQTLRKRVQELLLAARSLPAASSASWPSSVTSPLASLDTQSKRGWVDDGSSAALSLDFGHQLRMHNAQIATTTTTPAGGGSGGVGRGTQGLFF
mmetsp:Transcript_3926/g.9581  ORF Transcript_3926/g.9581 Transcript_3926/m.9581 type:complete len:389 (-) Transcript_3926:218-1384(-)|eukprot:CAMPEP_0177670970 /NCGR_PEP_ID=MMETSP0447-20121125/24406_1 /TAXON_ID=0 /ORGANISM="Stygamoeba regulata, Strain BSH-02190019" /LENGTH=388 /DNA_ID=CAMNT_0019178235 /DNA_START=86 /DNA_END=1252 /DNA_ORIENTATION=-